MKKLIAIIGLWLLTGCQMNGTTPPNDQKEPPLTDVYGNAIPADCERWFDGCNTCTVDSETNQISCTEKFCPEESLQEARCLDDEGGQTSSIGDMIRNLNVEADQRVTSPLELTGEARGIWFFEANFPIEIVDANGEQVAESFATAEGEWMTEDFVPFTATITFENPETSEGTLIFHRANPSGLPENADRVELPVRFNQGDSNSDSTDSTEKNYHVESYAGELEVPWDMVFTSPDRMLVTERPGRLRVVENGVLLNEPLYVFEEVSSTGEEGLMSVVKDPDYESNKWLYFSMAYPRSGALKVKVVRMTDEGNRLSDETVILDDLPAARFHAGCRLAFGPDGKLYVTVGDALDRQEAQNLDSLAGKILRVNKNGSTPEDNPFNNLIWSYGHRNPQGIDWTEKGEMYATEHGPSGFDGPRGGDELNHILKGGNYGWPLVSHDETREGTIPPLIQFTPAEPPGSLLIYSGKTLPQFKGNLFFGSLGGEGLMRIVIDESEPGRVVGHQKMEKIDYGRIRNVMEGSDGFIYFSTSNRDGRGNPAQNDDRILRIRPAN